MVRRCFAERARGHMLTYQNIKMEDELKNNLTPEKDQTKNVRIKMEKACESIERQFRKFTENFAHHITMQM